MNEQAKRPEREAMFWSVWKHTESHRNDVTTSFRGSNKYDNNDPCMLRHTAGCSFDDIDEGKSSLIDLEAYGYALAA